MSWTRARGGLLACCWLVLMVVFGVSVADTSLEVLDDTYKPVVSHFNGASAKFRFVSILSPT